MSGNIQEVFLWGSRAARDVYLRVVSRAWAGLFTGVMICVAGHADGRISDDAESQRSHRPGEKERVGRSWVLSQGHNPLL